jgi:hypothetical protein
MHQQQFELLEYQYCLKQPKRITGISCIRVCPQSVNSKNRYVIYINIMVKPLKKIHVKRKQLETRIFSIGA